MSVFASLGTLLTTSPTGSQPLFDASATAAAIVLFTAARTARAPSARPGGGARAEGARRARAADRRAEPQARTDPERLQPRDEDLHAKEEVVAAGRLPADPAPAPGLLRHVPRVLHRQRRRRPARPHVWPVPRWRRPLGRGARRAAGAGLPRPVRGDRGRGDLDVRTQPQGRRRGGGTRAARRGRRRCPVRRAAVHARCCRCCRSARSSPRPWCRWRPRCTSRPAPPGRRWSGLCYGTAVAPVRPPVQSVNGVLRTGP